MFVELLLNPVLLSVVTLCVLCLVKLNVLMSLIIAALVGAVTAGITIPDAMGILCGGFGANAGTALSYIFLGTFASAVAATGLADMMSRKLSKVMGKSATVLLVVLAAVACLSQNLVPVHIAFIPILIPPLLTLFNELKVDRRAAACSLAFGLKAPYICIPFGFGAIFMNIIADNMTANGMSVTVITTIRLVPGIGIQKKELREAVSAGQSALDTAESVLSSLDSAEGWGTWDLFGGGLISDLAKHSHLDEAQGNIEYLQSQLRRFKTELADVRISADMQVNVDGFLRFADYFFDGLFTDWAVLDRISQSQGQVQSTKSQIESVLFRLDSMLIKAEQEQTQVKEKLDALVLNAQL